MSTTSENNIVMNLLESFIREEMKPIVDNSEDVSLENQIQRSRLPIECVKRIYLQDFQEQFLGGSAYLYNLITATNADVGVSGKTIITNFVKITSNTHNEVLDNAINGKIGEGALGKVVIGQSDFHTCVEFTDNTEDRRKGLYDSEKLVAFNRINGLYELGNLESVFDDELEALLGDIGNEYSQFNFQTFARRIIELFARLSNTRLSMLFYTDDQVNISEEQAVAALDIFYNMMSLLSEAKRVHVNPSGTYNDPRFLFASASYYNKNVMETTRPSVFVRALVNEMHTWVWAKDNDDQTEDSEDQTEWGKIIEEVKAQTGGKFTWFARSTAYDTLKNSSSEGGRGSIPYMYFTPSGYVNSLTGIHLGLLGVTTDKISGLLGEGCGFLVEAFRECFSDPEVLKVFDPVTGKAGNLWNAIAFVCNGQNAPKGQTSLDNISDLQYALVLERIIAKVYSYLHVQHSSFDLGQRPILNMDFGLRFLTDDCLGNNELTGFRATYSTFNSYLAYISGKLGSSYSYPNPFGLKENEWGFIRAVIQNLTTNGSEEIDTYEDAIVDIGGYGHQVSKWSLCSFLSASSEVNKPEPVSHEPEVGSMWDRKYTNATSSCPYAKGFSDSSGSTVTHGCTFKTGLSTDGIPKTCPTYASFSETPGGAVSVVKSYLATLFKTDDNGNLVYTTTGGNQFFKSESNSMGYPDSNTSANLNGQGYANQKHAPIQLAFLDHVIKLIQILYRVNHYITFNEPYLRTKVSDTVSYYYGSNDAGSFEPITCYRFSNFHELNTYDKKHKDRLRFFKKTSSPLRWINAVNRDLSGDGGLTSEDRAEMLDNDRKIQGTSTEEYKECYSYFTNWRKCATSGIVTSESKSVEQSLYKICPLSSDLTANNKDLYTYQVFVKRFRPIYLPSAFELYKSDEPINLSDNSANPPTITPNGWSVVPHKHSSDLHFSKDLIIIPTNIAAHNLPRGKWFNELDWAFWQAVGNDSVGYKSGCFVHGGIEDENTETERFTTPKKAEGTNEYKDFTKYFRRDWMYVIAALKDLHLGGANHAYTPALLTNAATSALIETTNTNSGVNKYVDKIPATDGCDLKITPPGADSFDVGNTTTFDTYPTSDSVSTDDNVLNNLDFCSTWLYITVSGATIPTTTTTEATKVFPWVFWHSARGDAGAGPSSFCYGLSAAGGDYCNGNEIGFNNNRMRFHAVKNVMSQTMSNPNQFYKGAYDPLSCGTDRRWHIHGSDTNHLYYGCGNIDDSSFNADKYFRWSAGGDVAHGGPGSNGTGNFRGVPNNATFGETYPFANTDGETTLRDSANHPMTWSLWNLVRYTMWLKYKDTDTSSTDFIEEQTLLQMKGLYKEWWQRFTYGGYYTKQAGINASDPWPYHQDTDELGKAIDSPKTWLQAQTLENNASSVEWTNVVAYVGIVYNEVSDTHNSCLCFYTGAHVHNGDTYITRIGAEEGEQYSNHDEGYFNSGWQSEFKGWTSSTSPGAHSNTSDPDSPAFCYALDKVNRCRNFMALNYTGYNSPPPTHAYIDGAPKYTMPLFVPRTALPKTFILETKANNVVRKKDEVLEVENLSREIREIYPPSEEDDDEAMDCNDYVRRAFPVYPNWEVLNDGGNEAGQNAHPIAPEGATAEQLKKVVFCFAPVAYWDEHPLGNDGKGNKPRQVGERMMAFQIETFTIGRNRMFLVGGSSAEYASTLAKDTNHIISDGPIRVAVPNGKPWGQALVHAYNRDDSYKNYIV